MKSAASDVSATKTPRIIAFDYLRGYFILILIVDHLWRWPNLFQYVSGRGELWVSAAEGFIIISGLLVGYVHGYKKRHIPLKDIAKRLIKRGLMLYVWMVITTIVLVSAIWLLQARGATAHIPIVQHDWSALLSSAISLDYVNSLTHFLYLYAIYLVLSPLVLWLLRRGKSWIVLASSLAGWMLGYGFGIEWLQWQILFFVAATGGYHMDTLFHRYRSLSISHKRTLRIGSISVLITTFIMCIVALLPLDPGTYRNSTFTRMPLTIETVGLAFVWFIGYLSLFQYLLPILKRSIGWLLLTFGERSLTAYILHIVPLILCQWLIANTDNFWLNTLYALGAVLMTWALMRIPHINRIIPR